MGAVETLWQPDQYEPYDDSFGRSGEPYDRSGKPFTRADLDAMPDDGRRYELIDGVLIVTPAPARMHQRVLFNLARRLADACPQDLEVLLAPFDVALADDIVIQPDALVARRSDFTERGLPKAPLLAVEVLSPSSRRIDLMIKPALLRAAGCESYWVVDPVAPALKAWDLHDGEYVEVAKVVGEEEFRATRPVEVCVVPADLIL